MNRISSSAEDIAQNIASRLVRGVTLQQALRDMGYGGLWRITYASRFDQALIERARGSWHSEAFEDLRDALMQMILTAERIEEKKRLASADLELVWGKEAFGSSLTSDNAIVRSLHEAAQHVDAAASILDKLGTPLSKAQLGHYSVNPDGGMIRRVARNREQAALLRAMAQELRNM